MGGTKAKKPTILTIQKIELYGGSVLEVKLKEKFTAKIKLLIVNFACAAIPRC